MIYQVACGQTPAGPNHSSVTALIFIVENVRAEDAVVFSSKDQLYSCSSSVPVLLPCVYCLLAFSKILKSIEKYKPKEDCRKLEMLKGKRSSVCLWSKLENTERIQSYR
ncbi:hypothetical protein AV530_014907 [Patagioenas fasciata monilis]|uniref:Uncharacterized protein n=1 Tax=Patagioenas fasciata monilis TaxID=372326 RepID=A0A1V4K094_PATFA|nr:hypothetical protein AV530_014907 [Patagioenas fasciata monilis]